MVLESVTIDTPLPSVKLIHQPLISAVGFGIWMILRGRPPPTTGKKPLPDDGQHARVIRGC